jgi:hypothetical protein
VPPGCEPPTPKARDAASEEPVVDAVKDDLLPDTAVDAPAGDGPPRPGASSGAAFSSGVGATPGAMGKAGCSHALDRPRGFPYSLLGLDIEPARLVTARLVSILARLDSLDKRARRAAQLGSIKSSS